MKLCAVSLLATLLGCDPVQPPPAPVVRTEVLQLKANPNPDLDLLFVIDDSPSMADKQAALAAAFPKFLDELGNLRGGIPNLHIGVISSDMGTKGSAVPEPGPPVGGGQGGCVGAGKSGVLQKGAAVLEGEYLYAVAHRDGATNFTGTLADTFRLMATLGAAGCGFEQHLHALRTSFTHPFNRGFLRESANLAVIILADEDDCSILDPGLYELGEERFGPLGSFRCFEQGVECSPDAPRELGVKDACRPRAGSAFVEDIAPFRDALLAQKGGDARKILLSAIVGAPGPVGVESRVINNIPQVALGHSCDITPAGSRIVADPAIRIASLLQTFPGTSSLASVCSADLAPAVTQIGKALHRLAGDGCLTRTLANPAVPDCIVEDVRDATPTIGVRMERCSEVGEDVTCYELVPDATCETALRLSVARAVPVDDETWTRVSCVVPQS
ncbi:MAG TPA: hypothetical protein VIU61_26400 [Kofleriaceae bacterium]